MPKRDKRIIKKGFNSKGDSCHLVKTPYPWKKAKKKDMGTVTKLK